MSVLSDTNTFNGQVCKQVFIWFGSYQAFTYLFALTEFFLALKIVPRKVCLLIVSAYLKIYLLVNRIFASLTSSYYKV